MIWKKFLIALILIVGISHSVYAARSSTNEEMQYALYHSVKALQQTDDCFDFLSSNPTYDKLLDNLKKCSVVLDSIAAMRVNRPVGGKEALTCLLAAEIVLQERYLALSSLKYAVTSNASGDKTKGNQYENEAAQYIASSKEWRQKFKNEYGY